MQRKNGKSGCSAGYPTRGLSAIARMGDMAFGGPRSVVAAMIHHVDATERVPPVSGPRTVIPGPPEKKYVTY